MKLCNATWTQVEDYLLKKNLIIVPIGSTEQHGPTGIIGTDYLTALSIAEEVGRRLAVYVAPPICYGMARHHLAFPGSASLKPSTFIQVIKEVTESFYQSGFEKIVFVNGHGGNIAPLTTAFSEIKDREVKLFLKTINWYEEPSVVEYEKTHFGDSNGFHATCGEVSLTQYLHEEAFENIPKTHFEVHRPQFQMPLSATEFRETFPDGRMFSNPGLSTKEHGEEVFRLATSSVEAKIFSYL